MSRTARDSLIVVVGGQLERFLGTFTALALRWGLDPSSLGVYTGLRLYLDNTNRSSLGVGLGAIQEVPILRAQGRTREAQRVLDVAHTTNTLSCLLYAIGLVIVALWWSPTRSGDPLAFEWTWGLVAVAGLALLKRHESFLIAALRAHGEFVLTTELDIFESCVSAVSVAGGLWIAGFWGLLAAVGLILISKISYLRLRHPLRFHLAWHGPTVIRLMLVGLPILANTAAFGAVLALDRVLLISLVPEGARAAGLYTVALMGTSWSLDVAGRVVLVLYTHFQSTLGRTGDTAEVANAAMKSTEAQAPILAAGGAVAYVFAPWFLGMLMPRYVDGTEAIRPLMPGMVLLGLAWPARQMMIAIDGSRRLFLATLASLIFASEVGAIGAARSGMIGVAWSMSIGYAALVGLTGVCAFGSILGTRALCLHWARLARILLGFSMAATVAAHVPLELTRLMEMLIRGSLLTLFAGPILAFYVVKDGWLTAVLRRHTSTKPVLASS